MSREYEIIEQLKKYDNKEIEYGYCKSQLFGESQITKDEDGIDNRELEIFYIIRKAQKQDAPYMIFFNGGPGVGFTEFGFEKLEDENFFPGYNVVCMDQRGTGCSSKPGDNLKELKYYTARYISYDAEQIRKEILGANTSWVVAGVSYGGHIVRKYMELYPQRALCAISHGYGECSPITMKKNIYLQLNKLIDSYFEKYPNDLKVIKNIRSQLKASDSISGNNKRLSGVHLIDALAFFIGGLSENDFHELISSIDEDNIVNSYLEKIGDLIKLILNGSGGQLNPLVAYVDLLQGMSDEELDSKVQEVLNEIGYKDNEIISRRRFISSVEEIGENPKQKIFEKLIDEGHFQADLIDFERLIENLQENKVKLYIFASEDDAYTPVEAIQEEQGIISKIGGDKYYKFSYIKGSHSQWESCDDITEILKDFK